MMYTDVVHIVGGSGADLSIWNPEAMVAWLRGLRHGCDFILLITRLYAVTNNKDPYHFITNGCIHVCMPPRV